MQNSGRIQVPGAAGLSQSLSEVCSVCHNPYKCRTQKRCHCGAFRNRFGTDPTLYSTYGHYVARCNARTAAAAVGIFPRISPQVKWSHVEEDLREFMRERNRQPVPQPDMDNVEMDVIYLFWPPDVPKSDNDDDVSWKSTNDLIHSCDSINFAPDLKSIHMMQLISTNFGQKEKNFNRVITDWNVANYTREDHNNTSVDIRPPDCKSMPQFLEKYDAEWFLKNSANGPRGKKRIFIQLMHTDFPSSSDSGSVSVSSSGQRATNSDTNNRNEVKEPVEVDIPHVYVSNDPLDIPCCDFDELQELVGNLLVVFREPQGDPNNYFREKWTLKDVRHGHENEFIENLLLNGPPEIRYQSLSLLQSIKYFSDDLNDNLNNDCGGPRRSYNCRVMSQMIAKDCVQTSVGIRFKANISAQQAKLDIEKFILNVYNGGPSIYWAKCYFELVCNYDTFMASRSFSCEYPEIYLDPLDDSYIVSIVKSVRTAAAKGDEPFRKFLSSSTDVFAMEFRSSVDAVHSRDGPLKGNSISVKFIREYMDEFIFKCLIDEQPDQIDGILEGFKLLQFGELCCKNPKASRGLFISRPLESSFFIEKLLLFPTIIDDEPVTIVETRYDAESKQTTTVRSVDVGCEQQRNTIQYFKDVIYKNGTKTLQGVRPEYKDHDSPARPKNMPFLNCVYEFGCGSCMPVYGAASKMHIDFSTDFNSYPKASTCFDHAGSIRLPLIHNTYEDFEEFFVSAIMSSETEITLA